MNQIMSIFFIYLQKLTKKKQNLSKQLQSQKIMGKILNRFLLQNEKKNLLSKKDEPTFDFIMLNSNKSVVLFFSFPFSRKCNNEYQLVLQTFIIVNSEC